MFGIGFFEIVLIAVVAIVFVGPDRLPELLHKAGRWYVQARRMTNEVRGAFNNAIYQVEEEVRQEKAAALKKLLEEQRAIQDSIGALDQSPAADVNKLHASHEYHAGDVLETSSPDQAQAREFGEDHPLEALQREKVPFDNKPFDQSPTTIATSPGDAVLETGERPKV
jgi:sec-independent protein translocase protein TatB